MPEIRCDGEILRRPLPFPERYIHARSAAKPCEAYGFKLLVSQVGNMRRLTEPESLVRRLRAKGFAVIHLTRSDKLAAAVSSLRAIRFGFHERTARNLKTRRDPIEIDFEQLCGRLERGDFYDRLAERVLESVPHIPVNYEADLEDGTRHQDTVDRLCEALEMPTAPVQSHFEKLATRPLRESVLNFDRLEERMRDTQWASLFDRHR